MKRETKIKIKDKAKQILDYALKKDYPNLNTDKIATFWLKNTLKTVEFVKGITFFLTFTVILQGILHVEPDQITILLLITIAYSLIQINKKTTDIETW